MLDVAVLDPTLFYRRSLKLDAVIGRSEALAQVFRRIRPVLKIDSLHVLLSGPSGCGKSLFARVIHENSGCAQGPFVEVNCAAIPRELWEAEFFGAAKGAYTNAAERVGRFAAADGGTLFLDEIGELPPEQQAKLLRVLDSGCYERLGEDRTRRARVRIIAATNRDLERDVGEGRFRSDLYFRLAAYPIAIPSLGQRPEDVPELARVIAEQESKRLELPPMTLSGAAARELAQRPWPGNIRQLRSVVVQGVLEALERDEREVEPRHLVPAGARAGSPARAAPAPQSEPSGTLAEARQAMQRSALESALRAENGNASSAARRLGISRSHLYTLMASSGFAAPRRPRRSRRD